MKADDAAAAEAGRGRDALPLSPAALATLRMDILHHSLHAVGELLRRERACAAGGDRWRGARCLTSFAPPPLPASLAAEAWAVGAATSTVRCLNAMAASTSASLETLYEVACGVLEALCAGQGARARGCNTTDHSAAIDNPASLTRRRRRRACPHRGADGGRAGPLGGGGRAHGPVQPAPPRRCAAAVVAGAGRPQAEGEAGGGGGRGGRAERCGPCAPNPLPHLPH